MIDFLSRYGFLIAFFVALYFFVDGERLLLKYRTWKERLQMDYSEIAPNVYLGAKPKTLEDYEELIKFDIIFEFNKADELTSKNIHHLMGSHSRIAEIENRLKKIEWYHIPLNDDIPKGAIPNYSKGIGPYTRARISGDKIYVHCKNGLHRSAHFLIFIGMLNGATYEESFEIIHKKRKIEEKPLLKQQLVDWYNNDIR